MTDRSLDPSVLTGTPVVVLCELRVENLLLIERAELTFAPGLNVLTGETGAGKTVLAQSLDLLMGGPARPGSARPGPTRPGSARPGSARPGHSRNGIVRPGCEEAYVEGVFSVPERLREEVSQMLAGGVHADNGGDGEELTLARRVLADGRTRAYVNGRSATVTELRELGATLISFYGQHEHRKLVLAGAQLQMLDEVCGDGHAELLRECANSYRQTRQLESELERLSELAQARERELDLLEHELAEIDAAAPDEREHRELLARRERLRRIDTLRSVAGAASEMLAPESSEQPGATQLLAAAAERLRTVTGVDGALDALGERCSTLAIEAHDLAAELHGYREGVESEDGSLQALEERLSALEQVMRKHGGSVATVLDHAERARARRDELLGAEVAQEQTLRLLGDERTALGNHVEKLRATREKAALVLAKGVRKQLKALAMADATFEIALSPTEPKANGGDAVEFVIAPNPGVPAAPLREIASGGELSRVMLALTSACNEGTAASPDSTQKSTLVFDEVDAGIGGHTARAVGERLQSLAKGRQVLCITHLPQIAALADRHFSVAKNSSGESTVATVLRLAEREVVAELVRMLGAEERDPTARKHARDLRRAA